MVILPFLALKETQLCYMRLVKLLTVTLRQKYLIV